MFLTPMASDGSDRLRFVITVGGGGPNEEKSTTVPRFPSGVETHVAVTLALDQVTQQVTTAVYVNGLPKVITFGGVLIPSDLGPLATTNNYLGRSQYADPFFNGSINEFRIYNTALSADDVLNSFNAGPDAP
jgi:hypothetical protein